eukprot:scaffold820_cov376-Prasinococcus_capsulatus_cf.AAC.12
MVCHHIRVAEAARLQAPHLAFFSHLLQVAFRCKISLFELAHGQALRVAPQQLQQLLRVAGVQLRAAAAGQLRSRIPPSNRFSMGFMQQKTYR